MAESISFTVADIPPSSPADDADTPITSTDLTCEVCGTPLLYGGRGRKPKFCDEHKQQSTSSGTRRRSSNRDVDAAMAALGSAHSSLSFLLMLMAGDAAVAWEANRPALDERNRGILEADPKLAKRLATAASKGGGPALVLSHLIAVAPAAGIAYGKVRAVRQDKAKPTSGDVDPQSGENVVDMRLNPDSAFRG